MTTGTLNRSPTIELRRESLCGTNGFGAATWPTRTWAGMTASSCCGTLIEAFLTTGGVVSGDSLAMLLRRRTDQPLSLLARWIVCRQVLSFECHSQTFLPMFQFDLARAAVRPGLQSVLAELNGVFDGRELVDWFATPNCWLSGQTPVAVFNSDLPSLLQVARADRFVATG